MKKTLILAACVALVVLAASLSPSEAQTTTSPTVKVYFREGKLTPLTTDMVEVPEVGDRVNIAGVRYSVTARIFYPPSTAYVGMVRL